MKVSVHDWILRMSQGTQKLGKKSSNISSDWSKIPHCSEFKKCTLIKFTNCFFFYFEIIRKERSAGT